jgi:mRNA-degrading endonuclease RelE of RelBE toxin-antitoxin system
MAIKWNKAATNQLLDALRFIEENGFYIYAEQVEKEILLRVRNLPENPNHYPLDKYRRKNDGTYHAFEIDNYRISFKFSFFNELSFPPQPIIIFLNSIL